MLITHTQKLLQNVTIIRIYLYPVLRHTIIFLVPAGVVETQIIKNSKGVKL